MQELDPPLSTAFAPCEKTFSKIWKAKYRIWDTGFLAFFREISLSGGEIMPCFGFSWMTYLACTQIPLNFSLSEAHVKTYYWTQYSEHSRTVQDLWWQQKRYKEPRGNRNSNCLFKLFPVALQFIQAHKLSFSLFSLISVSVGLDFLSTDNPNQEDLSITSVNKWGLTPSTEREEKSQNRGCWRDQQTGKYKFTLLYWPYLTEAEIGSTVGYQTCMFCSARSTLATKIFSFPTCSVFGVRGGFLSCQDQNQAYAIRVLAAVISPWHILGSLRLWLKRVKKNSPFDIALMFVSGRFILYYNYLNWHSQMGLWVKELLQI